MESETTRAGNDLGGHEQGHPERLDRDAHGGTVIEAEHLARYCWLAPLAKGKRVLDAGCGTAYGTEILAEAGASEVVGLDRAEEVLGAVRGRMPEGVELVAGSLESLPFGDGSFDLIACFEVIEHLESAEAVLDQLARILRNDGLLAVSSPNRDSFPPGNPHHVHEYTPEELESALSSHFSNVRLLRQHAWVSSALVGDDVLTADGGVPVTASVAKAAALAPGQETFTIAIASNAALPDPKAMIVLGPGVDQRADAEHLAAVKQQAERLKQLEGAQIRAQELERHMNNLRNSTSWRITAPLRRLKSLWRRRSR